MVPALLLVLGCWRPDAYEPPAAPEAPAELVAGVPEEAAAPPDGAEPGAAEADSPGAEGSPPGAEGDPVESAPEPGQEDPEEPAFPAYPARTLQAPVTVVDDYGKTLAVLGLVGVALEVRDEEEVRTRVFCASCKPPIEGWVQPHLVVRTGSSPTDGSK
ncbi:MAG: hypothetical protein Q8P18_23610 [Pseudomonadota bacterium]|nr:hypothetical protein [Pseudomonadota bacterium]